MNYECVWPRCRCDAIAGYICVRAIYQQQPKAPEKEDRIGNDFRGGGDDLSMER